MRTPRPQLSPDEKKRQLAVLAADVAQCQKCRLSEGRKQTVFARGEATAHLVFVGEGPGEQEDQQGIPFVGPAGQLLDRMIGAMGLTNENIYICNVVKCRPPDNRKPEPDEIEACRPYLEQQLSIVDPEAIVALGGSGMQALLNVQVGITRMRGAWKLYRGRVPVMPTFHPAYLLRSPDKKREVWQDLKAVVKRLGRTLPHRK